MLERAARAIAGADQVVVTAGAGMGVDSGLPDFRGVEGFWNAYPPYRALGLSFAELANPAAFASDPSFAWGFYGHRRALYRRTQPHEGFAILRSWGTPLVITSNVDGHFHAAGFPADDVWEVHGTLRLDQCLDVCGHPAFLAGDPPEVDPATMRARAPLPSCPGCGGLARPNVLMFGDGGWDPTSSDAQQARVVTGLRDRGSSRVVVELGAGTSLPTIRRIGEDLARGGATLVRINPREPDGPPGTLSLPMGALEGLRALAPLVDDGP